MLECNLKVMGQWLLLLAGVDKRLEVIEDQLGVTHCLLVSWLAQDVVHPKREVISNAESAVWCEIGTMMQVVWSLRHCFI